MTTCRPGGREGDKLNKAAAAEMRVLFVAFEFPPLGRIGVQRSLRFAKYLGEFGVTPIVVTTDAVGFRNYASEWEELQPSLLKQVPTDLIVERIPCDRRYVSTGSRLKTWARVFFSVRDPVARQWKPHVEAALPRLLTQHRPDAVYVTMPPFSIGPLWTEIARRYGLPLLLDFRDPWSGWGPTPYPTWFHYFWNWKMEDNCMRQARVVVTVTDPLRNDLAAAHPAIPRARFHTVTNSYDAEIDDWRLRPPNRRTDGLFVIGYTGNFYYAPKTRHSIMNPWWRRKPWRMLHYVRRREDWLYRTPYFFFAALAQLLAQHPDLRGKIRVRFAGGNSQWLDAQIAQFGLQDLVECLDYLDHEKCLAFQAECDCLLVTTPKVLGGIDYTLAGKTFDYLRQHKPLLGFVVPGSQRDFLVQSGLAVICDPDDSQASARQLLRLVQGEIQFAPNESFLHGFHARECARRLAELLLKTKMTDDPASTVY